MEPQVNINYRRRERRRCCIDLILGLLIIGLAGVLGIIIGAVASAAILASIAAIIVLAVVLAVLILVRIIMLACNDCDRRC